MKKIIFICSILMVLFNTCSNVPKEAYLQNSAAQSNVREEYFNIIDYKTRTQNQEIPLWVEFYETGGLAGLEDIMDQDFYFFVSKNSGTNFNALQQWISAFRVSHNFARLVSTRIQERFTAASTTFPDQDFGAYFEAVIKASSDAVYYGAVKEDDFWIKKQYLENDMVTVAREVYDFLILVSIERNVLIPQINNILDNTKTALPPTREQSVAIQRLRTNFFVNF